MCWCWVGHFSFPPNPDWFLSTTSPAQPSPAQPCPTLPVAACCLLLCGQVVTVQCPVSGYSVHTIYTIYTLHSRCATTAASLPHKALCQHCSQSRNKNIFVPLLHDSPRSPLTQCQPLECSQHCAGCHHTLPLPLFLPLAWPDCCTYHCRSLYAHTGSVSPGHYARCIM